MLAINVLFVTLIQVEIIIPLLLQIYQVNKKSFNYYTIKLSENYNLEKIFLKKFQMSVESYNFTKNQNVYNKIHTFKQIKYFTKFNCYTNILNNYLLNIHFHYQRTDC
jgi:hypothetical protein